jgi:hypothetical protein
MRVMVKCYTNDLVRLFKFLESQKCERPKYPSGNYLARMCHDIKVEPVHDQYYAYITFDVEGSEEEMDLFKKDFDLKFRGASVSL